MFYAFRLLYFRSTVGREVDGPLWAVIAVLEGKGDDLGPLSGLQAAVLGCSQGRCERSWGVLRPLRTILGRSRALRRRSWAALGTYVDGLGPLSGPMWALFEHLGASAGGLGRGSSR